MKPAGPAATRAVERTEWLQGQVTRGGDRVVEECAVALVYNGVSHAVMMATPEHLEDFALGFSLSEGILQRGDQLLELEVCVHRLGLEVRMRIAGEAFMALKRRRRNLTGRTGCGLCGAESLEQAVPAPTRVNPGFTVSHQNLQRARAALADRQELNRLTGAVHAAAFCRAGGEIEMLREDVGRHNALDKLLGGLHWSGQDHNGFVLVTSRASYEMVAKTASAGIPVLAALSAPTGLAIDQADSCDMTLVGYVGRGRQVIYTHPRRITQEN
jgi:FdhD protein